MRTMERTVAREDIAVKLDAQVGREAKMVAAARGITLAEYISEILRPIVHADLQAETSKILDFKPTKKPKQKE
jgi:hypothetical protein